MLQEHNKRIFDKFHAGVEEISREKLQWLIDSECKAKKPRKVLDVGCNEGAWSILFKGDDYTGIDISDSVQKAKKKGLHTIQWDLTRPLPFDAGTFDVVFVREVIEHMLDVETFCKELKRVLKPGGICLITTPNIASLHYRIRLLFGQTPTTISAIHADGWRGNGHVHAFSVKDLKTLLTECGLKPTKAVGKFIFGIPLVHEQTPILNKLMSKLATKFPTLANNIIMVATK